MASLYSTDMSSVFSGGLVYEYSMEANGYGVVQINGDSVEELDDFKTLKEAFAKQQDPEGDGDYKEDGEPSQCPPRADNWEVDDTSLPAMPSRARRFLEEGAGEGPGLEGPGSQQAGEPSEGQATPGSGTVTSTATGASKTGAAAAVHAPSTSIAPIVCAFVVVATALFGTTLL